MKKILFVGNNFSFSSMEGKHLSYKPLLLRDLFPFWMNVSCLVNININFNKLTYKEEALMLHIFIINTAVLLPFCVLPYFLFSF